MPCWERVRPMDGRITLKGIRLYGFHGVLPHERERGQVFEIDVEVSLTWDKGIIKDSLEETVDYSQIYGTVVEVFNSKRYNLIETLACTLAERIVEDFPVERAEVRVRKPNAPVGGHMDYAEVRAVMYGDLKDS
ncbi:MAG: dihydroneopterin aldolase [Clostridia bacterium]|nr:dihydroneopterin aldolase [Clostridia bacterium]